MKKISLFALLGVLTAGAASAMSETVAVGEPVPGGYMVTGETITTTSQAKNMNDDAPVTLRGYIIRNLGDEEYLFQDGSDTMVVEIDDGVWGSLSVTPTDVVILRGNVDRGMSGTEIDVNYIGMAE